jgi:integrase
MGTRLQLARRFAPGREVTRDLLAGLQPDGTEPIGVHDLRHSLASFALVDRKMSLPEAARLLRHANQVTATVYAGLTDEQVSELGAKLAASS